MVEVASLNLFKKTEFIDSTLAVGRSLVSFPVKPADSRLAAGLHSEP